MFVKNKIACFVVKASFAHASFIDIFIDKVINRFICLPFLLLLLILLILLLLHFITCCGYYYSFVFTAKHKCKKRGLTNCYGFVFLTGYVLHSQLRHQVTRKLEEFELCGGQQICAEDHRLWFAQYPL